MNRNDHAIWSPVTQAFVAAGEPLSGHGRRSVGGAGSSGGSSNPNGHKAGGDASALRQRQILRARPQMLALEPRLMFDGAGLATAAEAEHHAAVPAEAALAATASVSAPTANSAPEHLRAVSWGPAGPTRTEIVFVESNVANYQRLLDSLQPGTEVHVLDSSQNGLDQILAALAGRSGVDALHILSHGAKGVLGLGSVTLNTDTMAAHADKLAAIGASLAPDADLLLYGCNIAAGAEGQAFVDAIARATQADVAASVDATGAAALGGNWVLETKTGDVTDTSPISVPDYEAILPAPRVANPGTGNTSVYVRPGGTSDIWSYGTCEVPGSGTQVTSAVSFAGGTLSRGSFQYSSNGGASWNTYNYDGNFNYTPVAGTTWRFVDTLPGDSTTTNSFFIGYQNAGGAGNTTSGMFVGPDTAPTDITSNRNYVLSDSVQTDVAALLTPTDIGYTTGGVWVIDSQSVNNLFTIAPVANGNTATLSLGSGVLPAVGQTATVTARYYDRYQTDNSNNPINGQGYAKTVTFTVVSATSQDLNFGDDLDVSTTSLRDQSNASVTTLSNGNFVSVWQSDGQGGEAAGKNGIYGRIYDSMGVPLSAEFAITTAGNGVDEITPVVTALNGGRFAVAYTTTGSGRDIGYRIVEANGTVGSQLIANTATAGDQAAPTMATLSDGSFVIAWTTASGVQAQKFNAADGSKNGGELTLDASGGNLSPSLAALSNGSYVLAWGDSNTYNIKAVVSSAPSTVIDVSNDGLASSDVANSGLPAAKVVGLSGGGFVVAWTAYDAGYGRTDIYFQRYNNAGAAQGGIVQANVSTAANTYKDMATVAALSGGGFVVGWQADTGDYDLNGLFGRRFSATGVAVDASEFEINQYRRGDQNSIALTGVGSDRFAAVWTDNSSDGSSNKGVEGRVLLPPNAAPVFVGGVTSLSLDENSSATDIKSLLHVSDSDSGQTLSWSQSSAPSHGTLSFSSATASSGGSDITPGGTITYTPTAGYVGSDSFTVQVSDGSGGTATRTITVTVNDVKPVLANTSMSVNENVAGGTSVGSISATGDTNGLTYAITGGSGQGLFNINSSTGAITVAAGVDLDYEAASSLTLTVTVDDEDAGSGADATATITINLNNLAPPPAQNFEGSAYTNNSSNSRTIGNLVYSSDGPAWVDVIDDVGGFVGETFSNFTGKAIFNDSNGSAHPGITYFQFSSVGLADDFRLNSLAANALDTFGGFPTVYTITGYQGGSGGSVVAQVIGFNFASSGTYGSGNAAIVYSKDSALYNGGNLSFGSAWNNIDTVRFTAVSGGVGLLLDTLNLSAATPPNIAPVFVGAGTSLTVNENTGATDIKGLLHASDADSGQTLSWSQSSAPSHGTLSFSSATASSGGSDITPGGTITYTPTAGYSGSDSFTVQVSDGNGGTATRTITVTVTDVDPVISNASVNLPENSSNGTVVTTVSATGDTNGLSYAITAGNTGGAFAINASTGVVTVANAAALNFESNPVFTLTITVDDEDPDSSADSTATLTINLSDLNEAPVNTVPASQTFNEDTVLVFSAANSNALSVADVDAGSILSTTLSIGAGKGSLSVSSGGGASISGNGSNLVLIVGTVAQVQAALAAVSYTPTANAFGSGYATLTISSVDNGTGTLSDSDTVTLNLNAVADTPSITGASTSPATQTSSGLVISRNAADGAEVSHFKISGISNGTLYLNDGTTVVSDGSFITYAQGSAGLKFTPSGSSNGSFNIQASLSGSDGGLGGAVVQALINTGITVSSPTIAEDSDSGAITITGGNAFYKLSGFVGGTLYSDAGFSNAIADGSFLASSGASTLVYFRPTPDFNGNAGFSVRGSSSSNDGGLSGSTVNALVTVTAVNDAPTLGGGNHVFTGTNEDTASAGALVSDLLASNGWADVDAAALSGLALTGSTGLGSWQYSTDGSNWAAVGPVSASNALLLSASSRLRYLPDAQNGETATLSFRAWDQTSGSASTLGSPQKVNTASNGGTSAFSSASGSASILVSDVNDAPTLGAVGAGSYTDTAANDSFSALTGTLSAGDVDAGASLVYGISGGTVSGGFSTRVGSYGTLSVNTSTGAYVFTPNSTAINALAGNASENFSFTVSDGSASASTVYTVNFNGSNDTPLLPAPTGPSFSDGPGEDSFSPVSGNFGGSDAEGSPLSYTINGGSVSGGFSTLAGNYGTLRVDSSTGAFVFTPDSAAINALSGNASETFTITLSDGNTSISRSYTVQLSGSNDSPSLSAPTPPSYTDTAANDSFPPASGSLIGGDRDSGSTLSYGVSGGTVSSGFSTRVGSYGTLRVNTSTGAYVFTPDAAAINALSASSSETFTFTVSDGSASSTLDWVVQLVKANQAPQLSPVTIGYQDTTGLDSFAPSEGQLAGSDADGGSVLSYSIDGGVLSGGFSSRVGSHGTLRVNTSTGAYTYSPNAAAINALSSDASDSFTVRVSDGQLSADAQFLVQLSGSNDRPLLQTPTPLRLQDSSANDSFTVLNGSLSASDAEGSPLSYGLQGGTVVDGISTRVGRFGTLRLDTRTGAYSYTPDNAAVNGLSAAAEERFVFTASDGSSQSEAELRVQVDGVKDLPVLDAPAELRLIDSAADDRFEPIGGTLQGRDAEGSMLSYSLEGGTVQGELSSRSTALGTLVLNTRTGAYSFTPDAAAINGLSAPAEARFVLSVSDGQNRSSQQLLIRAEGSNDSPRIGTLPALTEVHQGQTLSLTLPADAFSDPDGPSPLSLALSQADGSALPSWLRFDAATRTLSGTPGNSDSGLLRLRLTASDPQGASSSAELALQVLIVAPPPTPAPVPVPPPEPPLPPVPTLPPPAAVPALSSPILTPDTRPGSSNLPISLAPQASLVTALPLPGAPLAPAPVAPPTTGLPVPPSASPAPQPTPGSLASSSTAMIQTSRAGGEAFSVAVTPAEQPALVLFKGIPDQSLSSNGRLSFTIPADAFAHTDAGAVVQLQATQANGAALPSWLQFNASNGSFSGLPPPGMQGEVNVRVLARDQDGRQIVAVFRIRVDRNGASTAGPSDRDPRLGEPLSLLELEPGLEPDLTEARILASATAAAAEPPRAAGRASFSEQIRSAARAGSAERVASERLAAQRAAGRPGSLG